MAKWLELRLPALCDDPDEDPLGRELDEPLWPERWPKKDLDERHHEVSMAFGERVWLAQYQGTPAPPGGGMFVEEMWPIIRRSEVPANLQWVRAWDLAASSGKGDFTVGCLMARLPDGRFVVYDVIRKQLSSADVRATVERTSRLDPRGTMIELPQDPGQAGKDQAQQLTIMLAGQRVRSLPQTGSKEIRATGYSAQQQKGNVLLVQGPWNKDWIDEHTWFPQGQHDDQVDAGATAFNVLAGDQGTPQVRWLM